MKTKNNSTAYEFMSVIWRNEKTDSYRKINQAMRGALDAAIIANLNFNEGDFEQIYNMGGGYWFGVNSNGKGCGEHFYSLAIQYNNSSAIHSYEKWVKLKPFISKENKRVHSRSEFIDGKNRFHVTGFDFEKGKIHLVSYNIKDWDKIGQKKLHNFTNKEWLIFRKNISEN